MVGQDSFGVEDGLLSVLQQGFTAIPIALLSSYAKLDISESEMVLLLHLIVAQQQGRPLPQPSELEVCMSIKAAEIASLLQDLLQRGLVRQEGDRLSLEGLYRELAQVVAMEEQYASQENHPISPPALSDRLLHAFEQEFGRPMTPMEYETISHWVTEDQFAESLVIEALRRAIVRGKRSLQYIGRILHEWHMKGIRTIDEALEEERNFESQQNQKRKPQVHKRVTTDEEVAAFREQYHFLYSIDLPRDAADQQE